MKMSRTAHIQLTQMIDDQNGQYYFAERTAPPLGLLSIATHLSKCIPKVSIEVFDNAVLDTEEIYHRVGADFVGLSVNLWNYEKSLKVASIAKDKGSTVVMGGHHASSVAENILRNREYVDYVVVGDGERAFTQLVKGEEPSKISNLVYRAGHTKQVVRNKKLNISLKKIAIPDRSFVNLGPYIANYRRALPKSPFKTYTTFYSHKGCTFRAKESACIFCGIQSDGYRARAAEECWRELSYLSEDYGISYVMDVGDNVRKEWLRDFIREKPKGAAVSYTGYIRSDCMDEEVAVLLRQIPCHSMFIGIESGDDKILYNSGKKTTATTNLKATQLLKKNDINIRLGVILGLPGESKRSLSKTLDHVEEILTNSVVEGIYASLMVPLPGSPAFTKFANYNGWNEKMFESDIFDIESLKYEWAKAFTSVSYDELRRFKEHIESLATPICQ